jgi:hypothetical protein
MYQPNYPDPSANPYMRNLQAVKEFLRRPIVLAVAAIATLQALLEIVAVFINLAASSSSRYDQEYAGGLVFSLIILLTFFGLMLLGLWLCYGRSRNNDPAVTPDVGLSILTSLMVALIVLFSIFTFAVVALLSMDEVKFELYRFLYQSGISGEVIYQFASYLQIVLFVAMAFIILYIVSALMFIRTLKGGYHAVTLRTSGSLFFGVMSFIMGGFGLYSVIKTMIDGLPQDPLAVIFSLLPQLLSVALLVCLGVCGVTYSAYAKRVNQAGMPAPQYPPYGQPYYPAQYPNMPYSAPPQQPGYQPQAGYQNPYQQQASQAGYQNPYQQQEPQAGNQSPYQQQDPQVGYQNPYQPQEPQTGDQSPYAPQEAQVGGQSPYAPPQAQPAQEQAPEQPFAPAEPAAQEATPEQPPVWQEAPVSSCAQPEEPVRAPEAEEEPAAQVCPACGASVGDGDLFCMRCGTKVR